MRCVACDRNLSDYESTRKSATTGEYLDLCNTCLDEITDDVIVIDRPDLIDSVSIFDDEVTE